MLDTNNLYIEKEALNYPITNIIIKNLPEPHIVMLDNYKDMFCRAKQKKEFQEKSKKIILAVKYDNFIYKGAPVCQDFDNKRFYYCPCIINCLGNCDYCYLKGKYDSSNIVIFVNIEDYFNKIGNNGKYVCISYDTDLFPLEKYCGYIKKWIDFAKRSDNTELEIRTKFTNLDIWNYPIRPNVIFAFSLSPDIVINNFEKGTSNLTTRIKNIKIAQNKGFKTRICFDPLIYFKEWKKHYSHLIEYTISEIDINKVNDVSIGSFRISQHYLKKMKTQYSNNKIINFPYININGYYQYPNNIQKEMENYVYNLLIHYFNKEKIYLWK